MAKKAKSGKRRRFSWDTAAKVASFLGGVAGGANKVVELATDKALAPVPEIVAGGVAGGLSGAVPAASPKLRKLAPYSVAGGVIGGAVRGVYRLLTEPKAAGAGNAGQNIRKAMGAGNAGQNIQARFRLRAAS